MGLKKEYFGKVSRTDFFVQKEKKNQKKKFQIKIVEKIVIEVVKNLKV